MKKKENINVLDELNKGACMGVDAIKYVIDKVDDNKFREELNNQCKQYQETLDKISNIYPDYSNKEPHETSVVEKAMTWYGIQIRTLTDTSNSKIAELLLQGTNMGIIEGRKLLNNKNMDSQIKLILEDFVGAQEKAVENLKKYL